MTPAQFEARWKHDLAHAEKTLIKDGHVSPLFIIVGADGTTRLLPASFVDDETKAKFMDLARLTAISVDAEMVLLRAESWVVLGQLPEGVSPSQSDRRVEVMSVAGSARVAKRIVHRASLREIVRGADARPTGLKDIALPKGKVDTAGPMFELLPPKRPDAGQQALAAAMVQVMQERAGLPLSS
ncbi:hypothetical protein KTR66_20875 [Roseococcus sp. SDR]|uniref:hypothetical protein n=1 Tax=Roseococcus sp. SDR TaxID=2835532 RepID=UPI001BCE294B|nr:hypothetical protein [Roseococcus sp. SDR]MBS7792459.1 hypothetical protein [Roseococcus sp. SDR]MBV1847773.1 hypothetical protein [Roseococcus sp. SDR]